jgi:hypothetical protein
MVSIGRALDSPFNPILTKGAEFRPFLQSQQGNLPVRGELSVLIPAFFRWPLLLYPDFTGAEGAIKFTLASGISFIFVIPILGLIVKGSPERFLLLIYRCLITMAGGVSFLLILSFLNGLFILPDVLANLGSVILSLAAKIREHSRNKLYLID